MDVRETLMCAPIDVTVTAWLQTDPDLTGNDKAIRRRYNVWVNDQLQEVQRAVRMVKAAVFRSVLGTEKLVGDLAAEGDEAA